MSDRLHCIRGCVRRGQHLADCEDRDECKGCEPRLTAVGVACRVCATRTREALTELPQLWVDLAERPRLAGVSAIVDGEGDLPGLLMRGPAVDLRSTIRAHLVSWAQILHDKHGMPLPDEARIAGTTRSLALYHSQMARQGRDAAALMAMPATGPLESSPAGYEAMKTESAEHAAKAEVARDERQSGLDVIRALAEHLARHLDRLLADEDAAEVVVDDITGVHSHARKVANPARGASLRILCSCGSRVQVDPDEIMTCPGCGNYGVISWWVANEGPAQSDPLSLRDLTGWLIGHGVIIHERKLRDWADDGVITAVSGGGGQPRLFDPQAVLIVARTPRRTRRRAPSGASQVA